MMKQPSEQDKQQFQLAMSELNAGDPEKAIRLFSAVRKSWCENADILYLEGLAYGKLGKTDEVQRVSKLALELQPDHFGALCNLANTQMLYDEKEAALENYKKALLVNPDSPEVLDNYGRALSMLGKRDEAIEHYKKALSKKPKFAPSHAALAKAYCEAGDQRSGLESFKYALTLDPNLYEAFVGIGQIYCGYGELLLAEDNFKHAISLIKQNKEAYLGLADVERFRGDYQKSLHYIDEAKQFATEEDFILQCKRAETYERMGEFQKAYDIIKSFPEERQHLQMVVTTFSRICRKFDECDEAIKRIEQCVEDPETDITQLQTVFFAAGDLHDKLKQYDKAMEYYHKANQTGANITCDRTSYKTRHDNLMAGFSAENIKSLNKSQCQSERPVFILGMPRSGTTLTEQILSKHPDVFAAGELNYMADVSRSITEDPSQGYGNKIAGYDSASLTTLSEKYLSRIAELNKSAKFVTDKMPQNFQHIGLISLLFPNAKIIHCKRNALDNCLSIYFQQFIWTHDYATRLDDIGYFYSEYDRLMEHWSKVLDIPVLTVQYEDMVDDQETMSRKLLEFCGLEWNEDVMKFYESERDVATASYDQVRQPIYKTSKERWRNYSSHIKPLYDELPESVKKHIDIS